ncbi:MAG: site-specific integrase [Halobacteria archaeon]
MGPGDNDPHHRRQKMEGLLRSVLASKISEANRRALLDFHDKCLAGGLSVERTEKLLRHVFILARNFPGEFRKASRHDLEQLVMKVESSTLRVPGSRRSGEMSEWTKHDYKVALKKFLAVLNGGELPEAADWIKARVKNNNHRLPEDLLTEEEIKKMVEAARHPRDKALLSLLAESGLRIGELLTMRRKSVTVDDKGAVVTVTGKTGPRRARVVFSTAYLTAWLNAHPILKNDAPLWVNIGATRNGESMDYPGVRKMLQTVAGQAGIEKRVNPHSFRHAAATRAATFMTEAQMKEYFGWTQDSSMAAVYVHLSGRDTDGAILRHHGLETEEGQREERKLKPIRCRCGFINADGMRYCGRCGSPLTQETALEYEEKLKKLETVLEDEGFRDILARFMAKKGLV